MQYILFGIVLCLQLYNCYFIWIRPNSSMTSMTAAAKKKAAAIKLVILAIGTLILWCPMIINRIEAFQFKDFGAIQNHTERLEGFLFSLLLCFVNVKIRKQVKSSLFSSCRSTSDGQSYDQPLVHNTEVVEYCRLSVNDTKSLYATNLENTI